LVVGASNDPAEREADRMEERVMRGSSDSGRGAHAASTANSASTCAHGGGAPLPESVRKFFEPRFEHDFSHVRIHADDNAAADNERLGSRAFTLGNHISLARGEPIAASPLLAHELAHVVQNNGRAASTIRRKETWDFTPAAYTALKQRKGDLKIASDSTWVPAKLQENILNTLRYTLDEKLKPSATEGVNVFDFYHGHLVAPEHKTGFTIEADEARSKFQKERKKQTSSALGGEYEKVTTKNVAAYTKAVMSTLPLMATAMDELIKIQGAGVIYHTFETTAAGKGIEPADPRRNYLTPFNTNTPAPFKIPKGEKDLMVGYMPYLEFTFLVDEKGAVHVRPGGRDSMSTITGAPIPGQ
jgi:hypothetical protein